MIANLVNMFLMLILVLERICFFIVF